MNKNGFTLIELLAVIVILAIIALIATPIILGIINDAREESNERSVELYASAVRNAMAAYQLKNLNAPTKFSDLDIEYDGNVECTTEELYEDGSFYIAGCTVNGTEVEYTYGEKQEKIAYLNDVCTIAADSTVQGLNAGAKYNCTVDPNKPAYTFYVLTTAAEGAESVNLIMDSNIRTGGEAVKETNPTAEQKGLVAWTAWDYLEKHASQEELEYYENLNIYGPVTAMEYLQTATKDWTKTNTQIVDVFTDDDGGEHEMTQSFTTNARLPYVSEVSNTSSATLYLIDYLDGSEDEYIPLEGRNNVSGLTGYWTLSSTFVYTVGACYVNHNAYYDYDVHVYEVALGVRPVINLSI